jgi:type IV secretory pathway component VirB8
LPVTAVVSFEKTVYHGLQKDPNIPTQRNVATISYKNETSMLAKESVWIDNPRGFKACAYRVDSEELAGGSR